MNRSELTTLQPVGMLIVGVVKLFHRTLQLKPNVELTVSNDVHFACFGCRQTLKQREPSSRNTETVGRPFACPNCKRPMTQFGRHLKTFPQPTVNIDASPKLAFRSLERRWRSCRPLRADVMRRVFFTIFAVVWTAGLFAPCMELKGYPVPVAFAYILLPKLIDSSDLGNRLFSIGVLVIAFHVVTSVAVAWIFSRCFAVCRRM